MLDSQPITVGHQDRKITVQRLKNKASEIDATPAEDFRFSCQLSGRQNIEDFRIDDKTIAFPHFSPPGTMSFIPAGQALKAKMTGDPLDLLRVTMPCQTIKSAMTALSMSSSGVDHAFGDGAIGLVNSRAQRLSKLLNEEYKRGPDAELSVMESLGWALCLELVRSQNDSKANAERHRFFSASERTRILEFIEQTNGETIKVYDIADAFGLEPYQFSRLFKASFGENAKDVVARFRLSKAQELLLSSDMPLAQIALDCGFSAQSHMTSAFKKHLGVTPAVYRQQNRRKSGPTSA